ncbi:hypothetical protein C6A37_00850 [Desulfobacteraceae bacterium SEEP-SAG9]|nr:hypothetical protein C6A37_00850 [Desulfobacteraceae bacterium SEEP-SAG9]
MPLSLLFPLDQVNLSDFLSQYSEWIYFTLVMVFFISVAGITLRRHFSKPYVKPLIISVGLMLTIGVFYFKNSLITIFVGWGIIGSILLVIVGATIPYGLSRGFGLSGTKSFFLTYILFYILFWVQFPQIYYIIAANNLGLINLGLLILFVVAVYKLVKHVKLSHKIETDLNGPGTYVSEIDREIDTQGTEKKLLKKQAEKITKIEIRTIDDIADSLAEIQQRVEIHRNNLPASEREKISRILTEILKNEELFKKGLQNLQTLFKRIRIMDADQLQKVHERLVKVDGKERKILEAEIAEEEEKLKIEKSIIAFEERLAEFVDAFNKRIEMAVGQMKASAYPQDAKVHLLNARVILKEMSQMLKEVKALEKKLVSLVKKEKKLLKREKDTA